MALYLAFTGPVTDFRMKEQNAEGYTDHGKLFIAVGTAVIYVELVRDSVGGNGIFQNLLEVTCIVTVKQLSANKKPGVVINDHDDIHPAGFPAFRDVGKIAGIRLPDLSEFILFIGFPVPEVWVPG